MGKDDGSRAMTMSEVAGIAGVSPITVSRALRTPNKVAPETRERIAAAIAELGYVPNQVASSLASRRTTLVAAIIPNISNPLFSSAIEGLSDVLRARGYHLMIGNSGQSPAEEEAVISTFLHQRPCAVFLHQTRHTPRAREMLLRADVPVVEVGDLVARPLDMVVSYSNRRAGREMTRYLIDAGHRRIAFVSSPFTDRARERQRGWLSEIRRSGLPDDEDLRLTLPSEFGSGAQAVATFLALPTPPDAVLCSSALVAVGAIFECRRRDIAVPDRLAVAGFDDNALAVEVEPPLTTVRFPRHEVGRVAAEALLARLQGGAPSSARVDLGFEIVRRASA